MKNNVESLENNFVFLFQVTARHGSYRREEACRWLQGVSHCKHLPVQTAIGQFKP